MFKKRSNMEEKDPIAVFVHDALIEPGLANFAARRPDATKEEVQAASALLVLMGLATFRLTRLAEGLDAAVLPEGRDGSDVTDFLWVSTEKDSHEAREAALVSLTQPTAEIPVGQAQPEGSVTEVSLTAMRWGSNCGVYL